MERVPYASATTQGEFWSFKLQFSLQILILTISTIFYTIVKIVKIIICSENSPEKLKINIFPLDQKKTLFSFDMSFIHFSYQKI